MVSSRRDRFRGQVALLLLLGAIAAVQIAPLAAMQGMPGFNHDWAFPTTVEQVRAASLEYYHAWLTTNFGQPNFYAAVYPFAAYELLESCVPSLHAALAVGTGTLLLAGGCGAAALATRLVSARGSSRVAAQLTAGSAYMLSPFVTDALVAGHLTELFAYGALPWAFLLIDRALNSKALPEVALAALLLIVSGSQPQFLLMLAGASLLLALPRKSWFTLFSLGALVIVGEAATIAVVSVSDPVRWLSVDRITLRWETLLSAAPLNAVAQLGYFAHYAETAYGPWLPWEQWFLTGEAACGGLMLLALSVVRRSAAAAALLLLGLLGWAIACGLLGPLAAPLRFAFEHVGMSALIRELHHFLALVALASAVGVGALVAVVGRNRGARFATWPLAICLCAGLFVPYLEGRVWPQVGVVPEANIRAFGQALAAIDADAPTGRVLFIPSLQPIGLLETQHGGDDFELYPFAGHTVVGAFEPIQAISYLDWALRQDANTRNRALQELDVRYVLYRSMYTGLRTQNLAADRDSLEVRCGDHEPRASTLADPDEFAIIYRDRYDTVVRVRDRGPYAAEPRLTDEVSDALPPPSLDDDDPRHEWVSGARWSFCFDALASSLDETLFTLSAAPLRFTIPQGDWLLPIFAPAGASIAGSDGKRTFRSNALVAKRVGTGPVRITARGMASVGEVRRPVAPCDITRCSIVTLGRAASSYFSLVGGAHESREGAIPDVWRVPLGGDRRLEMTWRGRLVQSAIAVQAIPWILTAMLYARRALRRAPA